MSTTATTPSRIAHLADSDDEEYDHIVHGVAHGEDELTRGLNGSKYWPARELKKAAPSLEGQTVYKVHGDGEREEVGEVLRSAYQPGLGVVYEAGLDDSTIAEELSSGRREVSIEAGNPSKVDEHTQTGAAIMRDYEYTGLATTEKGASEANYTAPGSADGNPAVAALSASDLEAAIDGEDVDVEAALNSYQSAGGVRFRGTRDGKLDKSELPTDDFEQYFLFDGDTKSASSYPVVDSDGYLRRGNVAAAYSVGPRGRASREELYEKLRALNDAFRTPPIDPEKLSVDDEEAEMAALADDLDAGAVLAATADVPGPDDPSGEVLGDDSTESTMTDDNNDDNPNVEALLERVDEKEEEIESLEADLAAKEDELEEKEDEIAELEDEAEDLREQNEAAREQYAAALAEADTVFDEDELAERYTLAELSEKVDEADFGDDGESTPVVRSGGGSDVEANLSAADQERKAELEARLDDLEDKDGALAEKEEERVRAELEDITGGGA
ncbi:hypothetical protein [Natrinema amylolyticum]|uniref:hypothetical protein n=1 Tax=Natrinema amylolyticum TaxID=2878679 RepID=UPI001CFB0B28|nr:hypothetical protein [Natrinema amylolyticum]